MKSIIFLIIYALLPSSSGVALNCVFRYHNWPVVGSKYTCFAIAFEVTANRTIHRITGAHLSGKSHCDVEAIRIRNSSDLKFIPSGISQFFPSLILLSFTNNPIEVIAGNELNEFPNLIQFELRDSSVVNVPRNFFEMNQNIQSFWIQNNRNLSHVGENLLEPLVNINRISFRDNLCINQTAINAQQLAALKENLQSQCPDKCSIGNELERICKLEESENDFKMEAESIRNEFEILRGKNQKLEKRNFKMEDEIIKLNIKVEQMMKIIAELATRPCGC